MADRDDLNFDDARWCWVKALDWRTVGAQERWLWWEQLWLDVCELRVRYALAIRSKWWTQPLQLETLAALAAWVSAYDEGDWDDPPGKLSLLLDLDRVGGLLRDGGDPFYPERDRLAFERHLVEIGCPPPAVDTTSPTTFQER